MQIRQALFIEKIESYLKGRGRENILKSTSTVDEDATIDIEGLCNGVALSILEKIFYDCLDRHYQTKQPLDALLDKTMNEFFKEIEVIIATDDELLNNSSYQQKLNNRKGAAYLSAKDKFDTAIEEEKLKIPQEIKEKNKTRFKELDANAKEPRDEIEDYQLILIRLAEQQQLLSNKEANILRDVHIPDLSYFERFINHIFLLHSSNKNFTFQQSNIIGKFSQLSLEKTVLPMPQLENQLCYLDNPDKLFFQLQDQFPNNRLIWIGFPKHTVCAFRINDEYFYYDANNDEKKIYFL